MNEEAAKALAAAPTDPPLEKPPRRVRYRGKNPRRFREKYKELQPDRYSDDVAKVIAGGKTPAGTHRPIMVAEILGVLVPGRGKLPSIARSVTAVMPKPCSPQSSQADGCLAWMPIPSSCRRRSPGSAASDFLLNRSSCGVEFRGLAAIPGRRGA